MTICEIVSHLCLKVKLVDFVLGVTVVLLLLVIVLGGENDKYCGSFNEEKCTKLLFLFTSMAPKIFGLSYLTCGDCLCLEDYDYFRDNDLEMPNHID